MSQSRSLVHSKDSIITASNYSVNPEIPISEISFNIEEFSQTVRDQWNLKYSELGPLYAFFKSEDLCKVYENAVNGYYDEIQKGVFNAIIYA
ncbi:hypothetical protein Zmor_008955 [Zophobas morio]|uniref:Uncharacterized protein n=1 Tax=Zophobas morio TaxID=2755281 RepID=A0AA38HH74_9CUCU|nr:hypothetical protein Zmor_008955 [Zophobas morio]